MCVCGGGEEDVYLNRKSSFDLSFHAPGFIALPALRVQLCRHCSCFREVAVGRERSLINYLYAKCPLQVASVYLLSRAVRLLRCAVSVVQVTFVSFEEGRNPVGY